MAVTLDAQLLEVLACPAADHAPLRPGTPDDPDADALTCTSCGRVYEVRDGIPVLLLDEADLPDTDAGGGDQRAKDEPDGA
ncbi:Trm112 family protein [Saccharomonospora iraqiensis]|uniref:Trm112 family protein n=1 Tax=Saccharomonospora iraqiensis TaxID=52698 RepID=UPI00022E001D|nr:Trm112 family protein [Saccharomonospora iraqiensis]